jgi:signal transduction histidine kinase
LAEDGLAAATDANTLVGLLNRAVGETRNLAQSLDPFSRGQADLRSALTQLARECETLFEMACDVEVPEDLPPLPEELIRQLYRIAQEALSNAFRHGKAAAVQVTVRRLPGEIELRVQDDGQGFTVEENRQRPTSGLGLRLMAYRASALGGQLEIASRPDAGCTVTCRCPFPVPATPTATPNSPNHGTQTPPPHRR